jgi:ABC-type glycerol-3-phosphate transport system substrate-binding protein
MQATRAKKISGRIVVVAVLILMGTAGTGAAQFDWKREWGKTLATAETEGQVTVYAPPGKQYQDALMAFQEAYPRIKLNYVPGSGADNSQRLLAERRAGKYLADVVVSGSGTTAILAKGGVFEPLPPSLILPENKDPSHWFASNHQYADPQNQYVFIMQGNVDTRIGAYNTKLVDPKEIKSHRDVLNPKWKGKMVAYDPRERGHIQNMRGIYYNPVLGGEFLRRLFTEMDVTTGRDQRQMMDWVGSGKFPIYLFATNYDADEAARKGLPVGVLDAPPEEGYMSGGFGHLAIVNKTPHSHAAAIFVNWLLSKEGQLQWQRKTDNNSLRTDISKNMLTDQRSVPRQGIKYLNASLPQYEDVTPLIKIVNEALAKTGKK